MNRQTVLCLMLFSLCVLPFKGIAAGRAPDERIDSLREESSLVKLLESPASNCNRVCSLFMTSGNPNLEEDVAEVKHRLEKEGVGAGDAAALAVMYACGERALRMAIARQMRDSSLLQELPQALLPTMVKAYSGLPETYDGKLLNELNREITHLLTERGAAPPTIPSARSDWGKPGKNHRTLNKWDD